MLNKADANNKMNELLHGIFHCTSYVYYKVNTDETN